MVSHLGNRPRKRPSFKDLWQQQWEAAPALATEESIPLRILVQALVLVGIAATDTVLGTTTSLWAIPLSVIGATWSYYRRRDRNLLVKFCIAIGMIAMLVVFLRALVQQEDARILLAQLLIQLQVLHSFDLPRRKDLGYSAVIGLILLGVAGTLSETLVFGLWLILFLVLALPVLVLDYRSRLGLPSSLPSFKAKPAQRSSWTTLLGLSLKQLALVLGASVLLGLVIFACLPRLPGFQLRSLPVSAPIEFQGRFDQTRILNQGYTRGGESLDEQTGEGNGNGPGSGQGQQSQAKGPGKMDGEFYYGFNSRMNQNLRGQLTPKVVLRVRSQAETFWRVLAFDRYTGDGWEISRNDDTITLDRPELSSQFEVPPPASSFLGQSVGEEVIQTYTLAANLPNLIPAAAVPSRIYFPTRKLALDPEGGLRSPVALPEGLTYTVISNIPRRDRTALSRISPIYLERVQDYYLQLPETTPIERIQARAEEIFKTSTKPLNSVYEKALYLTQYLKQHYTVQPDLPYFDPKDDLAAEFLFTYQGGYPDHFSTTLAVMLRSLGIPCRLASGFAPGQFNPFTGFYVVRNSDAYALVEVFFPGAGWFTFDPIPGHDLYPASVDRDETFGPLRVLWRWVAGWLPPPLLDFLGYIFGGASALLGRFLGWLLLLFTSFGWSGAILGVLILVGLGFAVWLLWLSLGWLRHRSRLRRLSPIERVYQQMVRWFGERGLPKRPAQTPAEYVAAIRRERPAQAEAAEAISRAYTNWRYGGQQPDLATLRQWLKRLQSR
ncbi:DUF4129 domain-containing transglutaminase family protein [Leptolyngbya sp. FACHB-261]|uniref:transglutaminase TgpA family protein n=1 Tax=Leptolyngbya sp. FACHB-261 TaxID=2692806 RepID=UPI001684231C|nr:DUF4129 domain-containing transglutaminase family protein [Leptolyngbya sp. FACHB-261]MBD2101431.1 DUF4129 domain-containing protein [Leptolyngbya sp. FACHB-261]